jgi:O-succinylbenzoic acid--CoA ligase
MIPCPLRAKAEQQPDADAIRMMRRTYSYREFDERVNAVAAHLSSCGAGRGTRVAVLAHNSIGYLALIVACLRIRAVLCPLNTRWPAAALDAALVGFRADLVIAQRDLARTFSLAADVWLEEIGESGVVEEVATWDLDADATAIYTSGSTDQPKAVLHTAGNHYYSAAGANQNMPVHSGDCWLLVLQLYHVGGIAILFRCVLGGAAIGLPPAIAAGGFMLADLKAVAPTHVSLVPTQLARLMEAGSALAELTGVLVGGSMLPQALAVDAFKAGVPLYTTYGSTEMASQVTTTQPDPTFFELLLCGRVLPFREVRIGENSEIFVRGPTRFKGYLTDAGLETPFDDEGWFATGDYGSFAEDRLCISGRCDNMFISGGENIQPEEIERHLLALDGIAEAVVVPRRDDEFGERPVAFVRLSPGATFEVDAWRTGLERELPGFKVPVEFLEGPESVGMKPDRGHLRMIANGETL